MTASPNRYLVAMWEGAGTGPPELAVVRGLVEAGDDVTVLGDPVLADEARAAGAEFRPWTTAPHRTSRLADDDFIRDWEVRNPLALFARVRERFLCGPAPAYAADTAAELRRRPVDLVAADMLLVGALAAAQAAGVPVAALSPMLHPLSVPGLPPIGTGLRRAAGPLGRLRDRSLAALVRRVWDAGLDDLNELRAGLGLAPLRHTLDQIGSVDRLLVLSSRAFDYPAEHPPNVVHVGAQLDDPYWTMSWQPPPDDRPLVLVALSTSFQDQLGDLRRIIAALGFLPVRGLVTTGPAVDPDAFDPPANVEVVHSAPHRLVLEHAAAVITHAGHGITMKALAAGVPLVCLPMGRDQRDNAARVAWHEAGVRLRRSSSPTAVANAVNRVLADPAFRSAAARLGGQIRADAGPARAVAELHALARRPATIH